MKSNELRTAPEFKAARKEFVEDMANAISTTLFNVIEKALERVAVHPIKFFETGKVHVEDPEGKLDELEELIEKALGKESKLGMEISDKVEEIIKEKLYKWGWMIDETSTDGLDLIPVPDDDVVYK